MNLLSGRESSGSRTSPAPASPYTVIPSEVRFSIQNARVALVDTSSSPITVAVAPSGLAGAAVAVEESPTTPNRAVPARTAQVILDRVRMGISPSEPLRRDLRLLRGSS